MKLLSLATEISAFKGEVELDGADEVIVVQALDPIGVARTGDRYRVEALAAPAQTAGVGWIVAGQLVAEAKVAGEPMRIGVSRAGIERLVKGGAPNPLELPFRILALKSGRMEAGRPKVLSIEVSGPASPPVLTLHEVPPVRPDIERAPGAIVEFAKLAVDFGPGIARARPFGFDIDIEPVDAVPPGTWRMALCEPAMDDALWIEAVDQARSPGKFRVDVSRPRLVGASPVMVSIGLEEATAAEIARPGQSTRLQIKGSLSGGVSGSVGTPGWSGGFGPVTGLLVAPPAKAPTLIVAGERFALAGTDGPGSSAQHPVMSRRVDCDRRNLSILAIQIVGLPEIREGASAMLRASAIDPFSGELCAAEHRFDLTTSGRSSAGETKLSLETLLASAFEHGEAFEARVLVALELPDRSVHIETSVAVAERTRQWIVAIDLGTSAIAVRVGHPDRSGGFHYEALKIGDWLAHHVDQNHDEVPRDGGPGEFIPSIIGLSSRVHLRSRYAAQTLTDLRTAGESDEAVRRRFAASQRAFDISVPFPVADELASHAGSVVQTLKRSILSGASDIWTDDLVWSASPGGRDIVRSRRASVPRLLADVIDEIISLYVSRLDTRLHRDIEGDDIAVEPVLYVTHPSGVGTEVESAYSLALTEVSTRLRRMFPSMGANGLPYRLVRESHAAAWVIAQQAAADTRPRLLVVADVGAGTTDVTVAAYRSKDGELRHFHPRASFGVPIGGETLDKALADHIVHIADVLAKRAAVEWRTGDEAEWVPGAGEASVAALLRRTDAIGVRARRLLSRAIARAKSGLTAQLRAASGETGWRDPAQLLEIEFYSSDGLEFVAADQPDRPRIKGLLEPRATSPDQSGRRWEGGAVQGRETSMTFGSGTARLAVVASRVGSPRRLVLTLQRGCFDDAASEHAQRLRKIAQFIGRDLLRMGRLAVSPGGPGGDPPRVLLYCTGRTALWPMIQEAMVAEAAASADCDIALPRTLRPNDMKNIVLEGATQLVERIGFGRIGTPPNRLAIAVLSRGGQDPTGMRVGDRLVRIIYLTEPVHWEPGPAPDRVEAAMVRPTVEDVDLGERFVFCRALPGMESDVETKTFINEVIGGASAFSKLSGQQEPYVWMESLLSVDIISSIEADGSIKMTIKKRSGNDVVGVWRIHNERVLRLQ